VLNRLSKLSVKACARLGGYYSGDLSTPENLVAKSLFEKLLTPYVAEQLSEENPHQVIIFFIIEI
jgi:DnaJ homolog subfamily C member 13